MVNTGLIPGQGWGSSFELGTVPEARLPTESKPLVPRKLGTVSVLPEV